MLNVAQNVGFGDKCCSIAVYIGNQPPMDEYQHLDHLTALRTGDIANIGQHCGNGWRKVFNVYAKLLYSLDTELFSFKKLAPTWQEYRDSFLLQAHSNTALLFNAPILSSHNQTALSHEKVIHIIMGRTYAKSLVNSQLLTAPLTWLDDEFAINQQAGVIVCPYFDYRQLSNIKIVRLAALMKSVR
ncbi:hypothetical protein Q4503_06605 [Colwellia sp. 6_MG-2023]|uniref:DUF6942 family protein n=1 Tax=Colwellia sp. 6_MG-2023 TaxID=3062676 RepID=UPI0026E2AC8E|nr:hypothetical protein [Colwellia sp. 6_MG-2023]MDO6487364.1 hypothetical protein [Colwellia sp. 6_MG-2023]